MQIFEYKLHASPQGLRCPDFIDNGGYWKNPDDFTLVGTVPDGVEFYIPDTVTSMTLAELKTRQIAIHAKYPMFNIDDEEMTNAEVETEIDNWWSMVN
jgi:hypothetical protein|tara:strand:+ start:744 stop:1037 length:294 start_codon:yes stop_codon:yes gene_type:complete